MRAPSDRVLPDRGSAVDFPGRIAATTPRFNNFRDFALKCDAGETPPPKRLPLQFAKRGRKAAGNQFCN
jgi:hypothetical protein